MSREDKVVDLVATFVRETSKAECWNIDDVEHWFPKSVLQDNEDGTITVPYAIAYEKGCI